MPKISLDVLNPTATFECTFGRGCEGICCKNGRPSVTKDEIRVIKKVWKRILPLLRPEARKLVEAEGFTSNRKKLGRPMVRVTDSWCVFFNQGCVLHKIGAEDGAAYQYKPIQCALFPVDVLSNGEWYIRQWDYQGETWDLPCLNPKASNRLASESLKEELTLAAKVASSKTDEK